MKQFLIAFALLTAASQVQAQTFDFDMTRMKDMYSETNGAGYDILPAPGKKQTEPFYFSVKVPDGNYKVRMVLGGKRASQTTVRAENRRLLAENVTLGKGRTQTVEFTVNKRSPEIDGGNRVKIKEREKGYLTWDDKLTFEFNGTAPEVKSIHIERDTICPTLYLCGNSTVVDQAKEPWASWGQMITRWFDARLAVSNNAESGLTATSFYNQKRLDKILSTLKKGDVVVCEFGHNDEKEKGPGKGAWYHYSTMLKTYADLVRAKGATIVFVTPTERRSFDDKGQLRHTHGDFPAAMKAVAERENIPVIDLNAMSREFFMALGVEGSKHALVHYPKNTFPGQTRELADNTHFNPFGAYEIAKMVVMGMKKLNLPIVQYLRPDFKDFDPQHPDDWKTFKWAPSKMSETLKPDGN